MAAVLSHQFTTASQTYSLQMTITNRFFVDGASRIDVSAQGYLGGRTLGNSTTNGATGGSGGSYGGLGTSWNGAANGVYGDYRNPAELGSGSSGDAPVAGGGLVRITAGSAQIDGAILAGGGSTSSGNTGGGSGGGIYLNAGTLSGSGVVAANGGGGANGGGSGGGGRVALLYATLNGFDTTNNVRAHGGSTGSGAGAVGTVYLKPAAGLGELLLASHGTPVGAWTPLGQETDTSFGVDDLVVSGSGVLAAPEHEIGVMANSVTITNGGVLSHQFDHSVPGPIHCG